MSFTENLHLTVWDKESDTFEHSQLAANWVKLDQHNHEGTISGIGPEEELTAETRWSSVGRGAAISTRAILPAAITRYLIKQRAVGTKQIAVEGVERENIKKRAIGHEQLDKEAVEDENIKKETITIDKLDPHIIPIGHVAQWYRAPQNASAEPGGIWELMDGRSWTDSTIVNKGGNKMGSGGSELTEGKIPDMREKFSRGSSYAGIGQTGGSRNANLEHAHNIGAHSHVVNSHTHAMSHVHGISNDGVHTHTFAGGNELRTRQNAFIMGLKFKDFNNNTRFNSLESLFVAAPQYNNDGNFEGQFEEQVIVDVAGLHSHGGNTGSSSLSETGGSTPGTNAVGLGTDTKLGEINVEPPWVGLVYIMRVR